MAYSGAQDIGIGVDLDREFVVNAMIQEARDVVFNTMPIRLLTFDKDGNGIKLIERPDIFHHISRDISLRLSFEDFTKLLSISGQDSESQEKQAFRREIQKYLLAQEFGRYAILSHTWLPYGEITYSEWRSHTSPLSTQSPGYVKLAKFCKVAAKRGLRLAWMDTVCINKESSAELDESIRSMFKWYERADVCIAYLAETISLDTMDQDRWFKRGWTLQELLAPRCIKFFAKNWTALSDKTEAICDKRAFSDNSVPLLVSKICEATGLDKVELYRSPNLSDVPIWRKMKWAADREVTREEDAAYSLMGLFNISMPTGYGEGAEHAFFRLVREIMNSKLTSVSKLEIANWNSVYSHEQPHSNVSPSKLIPRGLQSYSDSKSYFDQDIQFYRSSSPITLSHLGICTPVLLMPSICFPQVWSHLNAVASSKGSDSAVAHIAGYTYKVLDKALFRGKETHDTCIFAVLNIADKATEVLLPENGCCLAVRIFPPKPLDGWTIQEGLEFRVEKQPVTFDMVFHNRVSFRIPKDKLSRHGMTLRTMYL